MSVLNSLVARGSHLLFLVVWLVLLTCQINPPVIAQDVADTEAQLQSMRKIAENFRGQLGMLQRIEVAVVAKDTRFVSVRRLSDDPDGFLMTFDQGFLSLLTDEEIRAVIAHELGHIWIFTHHPYLQTEELANRKALLLVPADSLEKAYQRVAQCGGIRQAVPPAAAEKRGEPTATVRGANASN